MAGWSPLAMAEWIEILMPIPVILPPLSPLAMAEWIEILKINQPLCQHLMSPLAMAEWIEIYFTNLERSSCMVSASDGGVD